MYRTSIFFCTGIDVVEHRCFFSNLPIPSYRSVKPPANSSPLISEERRRKTATEEVKNSFSVLCKGRPKNNAYRFRRVKNSVRTFREITSRSRRSKDRSNNRRKGRLAIHLGIETENVKDG
jgi:hypothetical protein